MLAEAHEIREIQNELVQRAQADLAELFRLVDGMPPEAGRDFLIDTLPTVTQTYGDANAVAAAEWYEKLREMHVGSEFRAIMADPVNADVVEQSIRFAASHLFREDPLEAQRYLSGQLMKWVNQPARETIIDTVDVDPIGYGWQRVTRPGGCGFCRMLADRGGVYTRKSVWFASHRKCNCGVVPSWDPSLPEVNVVAYKASRRMESVRRRALGQGTDEDVKAAKRSAGGKYSRPVTGRDRLTDQQRAQQVLDDHRKRVREWIKDFESRGN